MKLKKPRASKTGEFDTRPMYPVIQNVVSFAEIIFPEELTVQELSKRVDGGRLNKKRFPAIVLRKTVPKCTALCFHSGRMIIIGSTSQCQAEFAASQAKKDLAKCLNVQKLKLKNFRITNIVANAALGFELNLAELAKQKQKYIAKNEKFPGLVYKGVYKVKSVLIFQSGKLVFTGAKTKEDIDEGYKDLLHTMIKFAAKPVSLTRIKLQINYKTGPVFKID